MIAIGAMYGFAVLSSKWKHPALARGRAGARRVRAVCVDVARSGMVVRVDLLRRARLQGRLVAVLADPAGYLDTRGRGRDRADQLGRQPGGFVAPTAFGYLKQHTGSITGGLGRARGRFASAVAALFARTHRRSDPPRGCRPTRPSRTLRCSAMPNTDRLTVVVSNAADGDLATFARGRRHACAAHPLHPRPTSRCRSPCRPTVRGSTSTRGTTDDRRVPRRAATGALASAPPRSTRAMRTCRSTAAAAGCSRVVRREFAEPLRRRARVRRRRHAAAGHGRHRARGDRVAGQPFRVRQLARLGSRVQLRARRGRGRPRALEHGETRVPAGFGPPCNSRMTAARSSASANSTTLATFARDPDTGRLGDAQVSARHPAVAELARPCAAARAHRTVRLGRRPAPDARRAFRLRQRTHACLLSPQRRRHVRSCARDRHRNAAARVRDRPVGTLARAANSLNSCRCMRSRRTTAHCRRTPACRADAGELGRDRLKP